MSGHAYTNRRLKAVGRYYFDNPKGTGANPKGIQLKTPGNGDERVMVWEYGSAIKTAADVEKALAEAGYGHLKVDDSSDVWIVTGFRPGKGSGPRRRADYVPPIEKG